MYILFLNGNPQEIHKDLKHIMERKKIIEKVMSKDSSCKQEIEIGEVLEWESVEI